MKRPTTTDLPPSPRGKVRWPWTAESPQLPDTMPDGSHWPRISIVTPSYNQAEFIEETIRSVLLQGYPSLEYLVIDGGSSDHSVEIIRRYAPWLAGWVSEPDRGQAHAINKGFAMAAGELVGWLNSDDVLLPRAVYHLAQAYQDDPAAILLGDVIHFAATDGHEKLACQKNVTLRNMIEDWDESGCWNQPGTYVPQAVLRRVGALDENLRYVFDRDWMCRLLQVAPVHYLHVPTAKFRLHSASKTVAESALWLPEQVAVTERYLGLIVATEEARRARCHLELFQAQSCMGTLSSERRLALAHLMRAMQLDWRGLLSGKSATLCIRMITPRRLLSALRALKHLVLHHNCP